MMTIRQDVWDFLMTLAASDIQLGDDDSLLATRMLDSLKVMELVLFLEDHFNIVLDSDDLTPSNLDTINAIVNLIERKVHS
jgi:acyl carrier protein